MSSDKRHQANRQNALKSTGPKTEEDEAVAKFNALRYGLREVQTSAPTTG